ncbi:MAG: HAD family phosphatase [Planctomycetes bacterium]|nr:HAD family phosphatase [Planctomycetota bacterium]
MNWAAIFDWDGVIVDSSDFHEQSWERLAEKENRILPEGHFKKGFGMRNEQIIPEILEWTSDPEEIARLSNRKEELYRELIIEKGISPLPGVEDWLQELQVNDIPHAVASSTERLNITTSLDVMGMKQEFDAVVGGEDVENGKPDPEVFLTAAEKVGTPPAQCVVFEDAHVGIEAGLAANMKVVALATTHPANTLQDADIVVASLAELPFQTVVDWFE